MISLEGCDYMLVNERHICSLTRTINIVLKRNPQKMFSLLFFIFWGKF